MSRACARAWSSSANLGPGFDSLAVAHTAYYDVACVEASPGNGFVEVKTIGPFSHYVSDPNTAEAGLRELMASKGVSLDVRVTLWKGIPVSSGLGGSAASAVSTLAALTAAAGLDLGPWDVAYLAGRAEVASAGTPHYDNAAASSLGGLVVVSLMGDRLVAKRFPIDFRLLVIRPVVEPVRGKTRLMRSVLPGSVDFRRHVRDSSMALTLLAALISGDLEVAGRLMDSDVVTLARSPHVPCFWEARDALLAAGAYGIAISGAGPSILALGPEGSLGDIAEAGLSAYGRCGMRAEAKVVRTAGGYEVLTPDEALKLIS
ncbi:MAG: homoserine kinase [Acidilobus sp.]